VKGGGGGVGFGPLGGLGMLFGKKYFAHPWDTLLEYQFPGSWHLGYQFPIQTIKREPTRYSVWVFLKSKLPDDFEWREKIHGVPYSGSISRHLICDNLVYFSFNSSLQKKMGFTWHYFNVLDNFESNIELRPHPFLPSPQSRWKMPFWWKYHCYFWKKFPPPFPWDTH